MKRVVVTGMGIVSPVGNSCEEVFEALSSGRSGIRKIPAWKEVQGLRVDIAGVTEGFDPRRIARKDRRTMGKMAVMAAIASLDAIGQSGLSMDVIGSPDTGVAMGSTTGSGDVIEKMFAGFSSSGGITQLEGTAFMKMMSHSVAANVSAMLKTQGRVISPCCACATSTQAIGEAYEIIQHGHQKVMIAGGADDLHASTAGVFDVLHAASKKYCDTPERTPRPFDVGRDGLVVSEGAGALVLEEYDHAVARGAEILAEVAGYSTCCDGQHMTSPRAAGMKRCMAQALASAGCVIADIDYINAHATGTLMGDIAEAQAIRDLAGDTIPVSGTKGYTGHTLAASGVIESIFCLLMMENRVVFPTLNLDTVDPMCDGLFHVKKRMERDLNMIMTSNFAFGGINATLIYKKVQ